MPNGEFKIYVHLGGAVGINVYHWNGTAFEDPAEVIFRFDNGTTLGGTEVNHRCLENIETLRWDADPDKYGAFFKANLVDAPDEEEGCFETDEGGILFAEHRN
jgi:hypothetical protein